MGVESRPSSLQSPNGAEVLPAGLSLAGGPHRESGWLAKPSVRAALAGRLVGLMSSALVLVILVFFCSSEQRGIYANAYTAFSLVSVLELGVGNSAVPHFRFLAEGASGPGSGLNELLASYWAQSLWMAAGLCGFMVLFAIMGGGASAACFRSPAWFVMMVLCSLYLLMLPALYLLEGAVDVLMAQVMKLVQALVGLVALASLLAWHAGWAVTVLVGFHACVAGWFIWRLVWPRLPHISELRRAFRWVPHVDDRGRIGGAFLASLCPAMAHSGGLFLVTRGCGMSAAGQLGLTISLATVPLTMSLAWLFPRTPEMAQAVAQGHFEVADRLAQTAQRHVLAVTVSLSCVVFGGLLLFRWVAPVLASRFLGPYATLACLCHSCAFAWHWVKTVHLRSYGVEGLVPANVCATLLGLGMTGWGVALGASPDGLGMLWGYGSAAGVVFVTLALFQTRLREAVRQRRCGEV